MKKKFSLVVVICILLCLIIFSSCTPFIDKYTKKYYPEVNGMKFESRSVTDKDPEEFKPYKSYFTAGYLVEAKTLHHIPMTVNNTPVLELGDPMSLMSGGLYIDTPELTTLYIPSTILRIDRSYDAHSGNNVYVEKHADNFKAFYCGAVVNLAELAQFGVNDKCYIPAEKYDEFANAWITNHPERGTAEVNLFKANIKYCINANDMNEYYYVDYVENGTNIVNIPPDPEREGYKFDGWYLEKECYTKWNFNSNPILTATESNVNGEFSLYAKWIKK